MIAEATNKAFSLCMWMLLEPEGKTFFWVASVTMLFIFALGAWALRDDN